MLIRFTMIRIQLYMSLVIRFFELRNLKDMAIKFTGVQILTCINRYYAK